MKRNYKIKRELRQFDAVREAEGEKVASDCHRASRVSRRYDDASAFVMRFDTNSAIEFQIC